MIVDVPANRRELSAAVLAVMAVGLSPVAAIAHGAHVQARTSTAVQIEATYDSGEPMAEAMVEVYAPDDPQTPVFSGSTDDAGRYTFVPTAPGNWEIAVRQAGHGDIAVVPVEADGAISSTFANNSGLSLTQRIVIAGAVTWGCVGTALFFWRRGK